MLYVNRRMSLSSRKQRPRGLTGGRWADTVIISPYTRKTQGVNADGSQEAGTWSEESLPVLHERGLPAAGVRGLQGRADAEEAVHEPGQVVQPQAFGQLRRVPAGVQGRDQAGALHGAAAVRRRVSEGDRCPPRRGRRKTLGAPFNSGLTTRRPMTFPGRRARPPGSIRT